MIRNELKAINDFKENIISILDNFKSNYYVYAFQTKEYGIYVGCTKRLPLRIIEHCCGLNYNRKNSLKDQVGKIILIEGYDSFKRAVQRENQVMKQLNINLYIQQHPRLKKLVKESPA